MTYFLMTPGYWCFSDWGDGFGIPGVCEGCVSLGRTLRYVRHLDLIYAGNKGAIRPDAQYAGLSAIHSAATVLECLNHGLGDLPKEGRGDAGVQGV